MRSAASSPIAEARRVRKLTQAAAARLLGCSALALRRIERGEAAADAALRRRLHDVLGVDGGAVIPSAPAPTADFWTAPDIQPLAQPGHELRGYRFLERIGHGGCGAVYRALQLSIGREVAIKLILPQFADQADFIRRFEAEASIVAQLEHPHVVPLYDFWREPGSAYLVMRLVRGGTLAERLAQGGALSPEALLGPMRQVCAALHAAHQQGVIHRDLKPANILLDLDGNAYLTDFGIAKRIDTKDQTTTGEVMGSFAYAAPEQLRGAEVDARTDVYALGILLFELLSGLRPFRGATPAALIQQQLYDAPPNLAEAGRLLPPSFDSMIRRALSKAPEGRQPDVPTWLGDLEAAVFGAGTARASSVVIESVAVGTATTAFELDDSDNPYVGLRAFGEADAAHFHGREALVERLVERLTEPSELRRFLAVIGASGSGKSSAVRAGLLPALRLGAVPGSDQWFVTDMVPGENPFEGLADAILRVSVRGFKDLAAMLRADRHGLSRAIDRCLPSEEGVELLLVIDQFEELFTQTTDEDDRAAFLECLLTALLDPQSRLRLIVTLRADFLDRPLQYADFGELMQQRSELVLPMTQDELQRAIVGPAQRVGVVLEEGLVGQILRELGDQPASLPLLQFALSELFRCRRGRELTRQAFHALGGVRGALLSRAESVLSALDATQQTLARQLFMRLVTLGEGSEDTRRRVLRSELASLAGSALDPVIERFGNARLLVYDRDAATREATVEVAHEALIRHWPRLRGWLDEAREDLRVQRRLALAAAEWRGAGEDASFLAVGTRLEQFCALSETKRALLTDAEQLFVAESVHAREVQEASEEARRQHELEQARALADEHRRAARTSEALSLTRLRSTRRLRWAAAALGLLLSLAAGQSWFLANQAEALRSETARANAQAATAGEVSEFLGNVIALNDPNVSKGQELTVRHALDQGMQRIEHELDREPVVKSRLLYLMGRSYRLLGVLDTAESALRQSVQLAGVDAGMPPGLRVEAELEFARVLADLGRGDEALVVLDDARRQAEERLGAETAEVATILNISGSIYNERHDFTHAEPLIRRAIAIRERVLPPDSKELGMSRNNLGFILLRTGEVEEASVLIETVLQTRLATLGAKRLETAQSMINAGVLRRENGDLNGAEKAFAEAETTIHELVGDKHPLFAGALTQHASLLRLQARFAEAEAMARTSLELRRSLLGDEHPSVAESAIEVALNALRLDRLKESDAAISEAERILVRENASVQVQTLLARTELALRSGQFDDAKDALRQLAESNETRTRRQRSDQAQRLLYAARVSSNPQHEAKSALEGLGAPYDGAIDARRGLREQLATEALLREAGQRDRARAISAELDRQGVKLRW